MLCTTPVAPWTAYSVPVAPGASERVPETETFPFVGFGSSPTAFHCASTAERSSLPVHETTPLEASKT